MAYSTTSMLLNSSYLNPFTSQSLFSSQTLIYKLTDQRSERSSSRVPRASRRDNHDHDHDHQYDDHMMMSSRLVDENMIVLRKRIHEMKMVERNYEPPSDWMDWEKKYYTCYDSMICQLMGFLQTHMMNTRPCLALAMVALILLSVPTSSSLVLFHLMGLAKGLVINN